MCFTKTIRNYLMGILIKTLLIKLVKRTSSKKIKMKEADLKILSFYPIVAFRNYAIFQYSVETVLPDLIFKFQEMSQEKIIRMYETILENIKTVFFKNVWNGLIDKMYGLFDLTGYLWLSLLD